jgi:hypothetical protein
MSGMKIFTLLAALMFNIVLYAQTSLKFCVQVDTLTGNCAKPTNEFGVSKDGGTISMRLGNDSTFQTSHVRYKIYFVDATGNEALSQTLEQNVQPQWTYAWQDIVFYNSGLYKVMAYSVINDSETFINSAVLKILEP